VFARAAAALLGGDRDSDEWGKRPMSHLTFHELARANRERCENGFHRAIDDWSPADWATAVAADGGEACNLIQKLRRGEPVDLNAIADELADVVMNADLLCQRLGLDLGTAVRRKFNEVSRRVKADVEL
jgi:NTP pyrophosphatase (non-canonical NTP hydrolase)